MSEKHEKYQEALDELELIVHDEYDGTSMLNGYLEKVKTLQELVDKSKPKKFEIIDRDLIFHSTPHPTKYYLTIRCSCGGEFECAGYQHWKVIDKHNVAKDYFEYEYSCCPHCGQKLDWSEE